LLFIFTSIQKLFIFADVNIVISWYLTIKALSMAYYCLERKDTLQACNTKLQDE